MKNLEKRKRIMQRSIRLGHCICEPKKPCPCDLFKEKDICLCAGERLDIPAGPVQLTRLVEKAGCASKIDQAFLKQVLKGLPASDDPHVLVGVPAGDDAGVYDLGNGQALVQTVDIFTPSVDDPCVFGQVAAANSVSDIYAMGGKPSTALSILGFPARTIPDQVMSDILRGGLEKMAEAGVAVIGGHSINDPEIKAGFAVTGIIDPKKIVTNAGAQPGDVLVLTKPLGTGIIAFAAQIDRAAPESVRAAAASMAALNKTASELMVAYQAHACTDVTGFSLLGHLSEMAFSSGVDVQINFDDIPLFPGVLEAVAEGIIPGAVERNKESCGSRVAAGAGVAPEMLDICYDAQTSGGLLICIEPAKAQEFVLQLHKAGITPAAIIGKVLAKGTGNVLVETTGKRTIKTSNTCCQKQPAPQESPACCTEPAVQESACCAETPAPVSCCGGGTAAAAPSGVQEQFQAFLKTANAPGTLDAATKQALAIALSVLARCEPCLKIHINKAKTMGFTDAEIDEAAWMAIGFGGSPTMMFYNEVKKSLEVGG